MKFLALLFLLACPSWGAIARTQVASNTSFGLTSNVFTITFSSAVGAGDTLVVCFTTYNSSVTVFSSISDPSSNTWAQVNNVVLSNKRLYVYKAENVAAAGSLVVTVTMNQTDFFTILGVGYSGVATSSVVDGNSTASNASSSTPAPGSFSTSVADTVLLGFAYTDTGTITAGSGYTKRVNNGNGSSIQLAMEDQIVSSTGSYNPDWSNSGSGVWLASGLALKGAGAAPASKPAMLLLGVQ